jgi:methionyl-tRNA synthetase
MSEPKRYTVTAALPYANGPLHIGHVAGCYLPSDIYIRYLRRKGKDTAFICGTDEHGAAINLKAKSENISPQEVVDKYHAQMKEAFDGLGISFDIFSRTSKAIHHETAQAFFTELYQKGSLESKTTEQYYDQEAQQFLADRFIQGECPKCGYAEAYGDQCERCGSTLSPTELISPKSRLSGAVPVKKETTHWFLPLDHLSGKIKAYIQEHKDWKANVYGQCMSWLDSGDGLQARSMTRDLEWGIPVPLPEANGKVLYVWFDAPIGYISATKELKGEDWKAYWQAEDTKLVHFIGKDNIVFHCIIFPAMLMEHGGFKLPDAVPANEFLNLEGEKISTSRNWAVWLHEYLQDFEGQQDVLRYVLCANAPETKDNDFTWKDFQTRNNSELVAIFGNFINRVLVLMQKYYQGQIPAPHDFSPEDLETLETVEQSPTRIATAIEQYRFRQALQELMALARTGNKYLADAEPWKKVKTDPERTQTIMYVAAQVAAQLAQCAEPFLPFTAQKLRTSLNMDLKPWDQCMVKEQLPAGHTIEKGELLFKKIEDEEIQRQLEKLDQARQGKNEPSYPALKEESSFEDFSKLDLRTGTIIKAQAIPKAKRLLQLEVDLGFEKRTIVSGIAEHFKAEDLPGQSVVVLANLAPRKLRGVNSNGMILMAEDAEGKLQFAQVPHFGNGRSIS